MPDRNPTLPLEKELKKTITLFRFSIDLAPLLNPNPPPDSHRAGILKQSVWARNRVGIGLPYQPARGGIFKLLMSPKIDSKEPM